MSPKEIAAKYGAKVFDSAEAAESAGWRIAESYAPRNVWNKMSATHAIMHSLKHLLKEGEASEIGLVLENFRVSGCYLPKESETV
jgi:hypothetical protein